MGTVIMLGATLGATKQENNVRIENKQMVNVYFQ
jgi:hypothetical protein